MDRSALLVNLGVRHIVQAAEDISCTSGQAFQSTVVFIRDTTPTRQLQLPVYPVYRIHVGSRSQGSTHESYVSQRILPERRRRDWSSNHL